jgi:4-hydroxy-tetrahydrodipicolinate reductase
MADKKAAISVAVAGICGRMGGQSAIAIIEDGRLDLVLGLEAPGHASIGGEIRVDSTDGSGRSASVPVVEASQEALEGISVLVDFSSAGAVAGHAQLCASAGAAYVGGVTGLDSTQMESLEAAGEEVPVVYSPNMSAGINLLSRLVRDAADMIPAGYDVEIVETHHKAKLDVPSGTAAMLAGRAAKGGAIEVSRPQGMGKRTTGAVAVHSLRGGDVVGEHEVRFIGMGETLTLSHKAHSRMAFARGVPPAVVFVSKAAPGFYSMEDVLNEME